MALRMLDLARPLASPAGQMPEESGKQWWPASWKVPSGFTRHLWFITPPKKLEQGQHDLMHEMQDMAAHGGGVASTTTACRRRRGKGLVRKGSAGLEASYEAASQQSPGKGTSESPLVVGGGAGGSIKLNGE